MKLLLRIKIYLVPNLENLTIRVLVTNISHLYETEIVGDLTVEKTIVACVAYKGENGQLVPEVKFDTLMQNLCCQWCNTRVLTVLAIILLFLIMVLLMIIAIFHSNQ